MTTTLDFSAFGKNDIRGIYGEDITEELFYYVGKAYVRYVCEQLALEPKDLWISVAKDARIHSTSLTKSLIKGVVSIGANVVDIGLVPTPLGYFSECVTLPAEINQGAKINGALVVTASHNPSEYNGLKMTCNRASLNEAQIQKIKKMTMSEISKKESASRFGLAKKYDIIPQYTDRMIENFNRIGEGIKVVVDSANATGGVVAPKLYRELGCEVFELYSEPDGTFPNHHPNPSDEKTLVDIKNKVVEIGADLGIAFDGDTDRIGVIDSSGNSLSGDKLLLIYALDIISDLVKRGEVPTVVSEVKCSQVLFDTIEKAGGRAIMHKTGHGFIKTKMKEEKAILAGEMSGHIFFKDRYYGFDDAIYAGCRIIEIVAKNKRKDPNFKLESLLGDFEGVYLSKEVRFHCENSLKQTVLKLLANKIEQNPKMFKNEIKKIITIDGLRMVFDDGFALIRQSNTEPVFTLRFEAKTKKDCELYQNVMIKELEKCMKECK